MCSCKCEKNYTQGFEEFLHEIRTNQISYGRRYLPNEYYDDIRDYYDYTKSNQGFIGKSWDFIKNKLNFKSGSKNVENTLNNLANDRYNQINEDEAIKLVNKYAKSQLSSRIFVRNAAASSLAGLAIKLAKYATKNAKGSHTQFCVGLAAAVVAGALGAVAIKAVDAKTAKRKYSKGEVLNDLTQGSLQGTISGLISIGPLDATQIGNAKVLGSKAGKLLDSKIGQKIVGILKTEKGRKVMEFGKKFLEKSITKFFLKTMVFTSATLYEVRSRILERAVGKELAEYLMKRYNHRQITDNDKYEKYEYYDPREQKAA